MPARPMASRSITGLGRPEPSEPAFPRAVPVDPAATPELLWSVAALTGDWSPASISRVAAVHHDDARRAVARAREIGLLGDDPAEPVDPDVVVGLIGRLADDERARIHGAAARACFRLGPDHHRRALHHARAAGVNGLGPDAVDLLDRAGSLSLALGAYDDARDLLTLADDLDPAGDPERVGRRACSLVDACDGAGDAAGSRAALMRAIAASEASDDPDLVARIATRCALAPNSDHADRRAERFLCHTGRVDLAGPARAAVLAARAIVEHRVPLIHEGGPVTGWVSRPGVARPLADRALAMATDTESRLVALLAWRSSHRSPEHLELRRERSGEALDLAQRRRHTAWQVQSGVALAVDCLEGGDRSGYDRAVDIVGWVALGDGNPRLRWQASALETGRAFLDGDLATAGRLRERTAVFASAAEGHGSVVADWWFAAQAAEALGDDRPPRDLLPSDHDPITRHPVVAATVARWRATVGDRDAAEQSLRRALAAVDPETTGLLLATRAAAAAAVLGVPDLSRAAVDLLEPWVGRVAVDPDGWWCDGPVEGWLALLGPTHDRPGARTDALDLARRIRDDRSTRRLTALQGGAPAAAAGLTDRERRVLNLVAAGRTNAQIAAELNYSVSTIRQTIAGLYDRWGTRHRHELVAMAQTRSIVDRRALDG